jgi:hypothetical protein
MTNTRKRRRSAWLATAGAALALLLGLPSTASATCTAADPTGQPTSGFDLSENPWGETAVQTCSPFEFREIGRRH